MSNFEDMKRGPKVPNPVDIEVGSALKHGGAYLE